MTGADDALAEIDVCLEAPESDLDDRATAGVDYHDEQGLLEETEFLTYEDGAVQHETVTLE